MKPQKQVREIGNGPVSGKYGDFYPMPDPWSYEDRGSCGFSESRF